MSHLLTLADEFPELTHMIFDNVGEEMIFVLQFTCKKIRLFIQEKYNNKYQNNNSNTGLKWICAFGQRYARQRWIELVKWSKNFGYGHGENVAGAAATAGDMEIVKWLYENDCPCDGHIAYKAVKNSNIDIFEWAADKFKFDTERLFSYAISAGDISVLSRLTEKYNYIFTENTFVDAARDGRWDIFQYIDEANISRGINNEKLVYSTTSEAAKYGHVDFLKKIVTSKYSNNIDKSDYVIYCCIFTVYDLDFLKWMRSEGFQWHARIYGLLIGSGDPACKEILLWIRSQGLYPDSVLSHLVCPNPSMSGIKWAIKNRFLIMDSSQTKKEVCEEFASSGNLEGIKWTIKHNYFIITNDLLFMAIRSKNIELIKFISDLVKPTRDALQPRDIKLINHYALLGNIEVIKFLIDNNLEDYKILCTCSAMDGNLEALELINKISHENMLKYAVTSCYKAVKWCQLSVVKWILETFPELEKEILTTKLFVKATMTRHYSVIELLDFLKKKHCPFDKGVREQIIKHGKLSTIRWLDKNGFP